MGQKLITAIYDKKAKTIGRPIYQDNIEKAIQGVKDALNSMNSNGEYLMPQHREHPEDYCLLQLGYLREDIKEYYEFNPETGKYEKHESNKPYIEVEEKVICEFKDIELKEIQQKISAETVYQIINDIKKEMSTDIYDNVIKGMAETNEAIQKMQEKIAMNGQKNTWRFWQWKK